jgi:alkanesulfonate monooxygenase SsuD/methylene tetrahydromethanopterin reductase-like flavin-dependent oxidoreductase (luciferase family)
MQLGLGLPATIPGADRSLILEWARRADLGPFSSLSVLDRTVYDNFEPLSVLGAAAAVTKRITLATTIVIAPLRSPALLAKRAATVQALSKGRLVLGVGLGAREDDYLAGGIDYRSRGRRLTEGLITMRNLWEDRAISPDVEPPRLLFGGSGGLGMSRMARYADGYVHGGGPPRAFLRAATEARAAWHDLGRPGSPALWGMAYFHLGRHPEAGAAYLRDYYAFAGPFADRIAAGLLTDAAAIEEFAEGYAEAGCDELILFPTVADLAEVDRLAAVISGVPCAS